MEMIWTNNTVGKTIVKQLMRITQTILVVEAQYHWNWIYLLKLHAACLCCMFACMQHAACFDISPLKNRRGRQLEGCYRNLRPKALGQTTTIWYQNAFLVKCTKHLLLFCQDLSQIGPVVQEKTAFLTCKELAKIM